MTDDQQLILYDCAEAPSARRARMFIVEKGGSVSRINVDIRAGQHLSPEYLAINPTGLVPALKVPTGEIITENDGIAAYLEALWPDPPLLGSTAMEKGRVAQWNARVELEGLLPAAAFLRNSHPAFSGRATPGVQSFEQIPALVERSRSQLEMFVPQLNSQLSQNSFIAGSDFTYADITAIIFVDFVSMIQIDDLKSFSALRDWQARVTERSSYRI